MVNFLEVGLPNGFQFQIIYSINFKVFPAKFDLIVRIYNRNRVKKYRPKLAHKDIRMRQVKPNQAKNNHKVDHRLPFDQRTVDLLPFAK